MDEKRRRVPRVEAPVEVAEEAPGLPVVDRSADQSERDVEEIQRLMRGFAGELRKLEEGLRILSAYVTRMRSRADTDRPHTLH